MLSLINKVNLSESQFKKEVHIFEDKDYFDPNFKIILLLTCPNAKSLVVCSNSNNK